jgi:hypothetical protein
MKSELISERHLARRAVIYIRQSTRQVHKKEALVATAPGVPGFSSTLAGFVDLTGGEVSERKI